MNIVVVGGGTAGWLTALLVRSFYPNENITLIESDEIGILGAGEGTTPAFLDILSFIGINFSEIIKYCDGTIKTGVRFTNWNGDNKDYYHELMPQEGLNLYSLDFPPYLNNISFFKQLGEGKPIDDIVFMKKLSNNNKVPFYSHNKEIHQCGSFALHFNAKLLAGFLSKKAQERNIKRVEGKVCKIINDCNGNVSSLILNNDKSINVDFIFDCSGFSRLLIGKHYNTEWISYKEYLPLDSALPFFIPHDNTDIKPETEAIAMKYGWVWKIPVRNRYGCGYVFDSSYINENDAVKEIEDHFNIKIDNKKSFKFNAGSYKKTYVKNCIAIGLSQSFVEPLEATSIWVACVNLIQFLQADGINVKSETYRKIFNNNCLDRNKKVVEFLYIHYMTKRKDSKFWTEFKTKTKCPELVSQKIELWKDVPEYQISDSFPFDINNWLQIADGLELIDRNKFSNRLTRLKLQKIVNRKYNEFIEDHKKIKNLCYDHMDFINTFNKQ